MNNYNYSNKLKHEFCADYILKNKKNLDNGIYEINDVEKMYWYIQNLELKNKLDKELPNKNKLKRGKL